MPHEIASYSRGYGHAYPALLESKGVSLGGALRQRVQQGFGFLEVSGVKALGEPAIDRGENIVGFDALALITPKVSKSGGGTQFPAPRILLSSDLDRRLKVCLHRLDRSLGLQQEFGPYLM